MQLCETRNVIVLAGNVDIWRIQMLLDVDDDNFPVLEAVTPQKPSADSINIRFTDNKIRILERGEEFSYVEHLSSGYCLRMYNHYIYDFDNVEKEVTSCEDYTDYLLPVAAGDKLALIHKTSEGCMVKKNGVSGWYLGELR